MDLKLTLFLSLFLALMCTGVFAKELNVRDFGAVGDGKTDDTASFQRALDEAGKEQGSVVFAPIGNYLIESNIVIPAGVTLKGVWEIPTAFTQNKGTTLLATGGAGTTDGPPLILLHSNSTLKGLTIYYPDQKREQDEPTPYPWTIANVHGDNVSVIDVLAVNPYMLMNLTLSGRHYVRGVYGQPLYRGIYVDQCYDVGRIENVHLWPFFTGWLPQNKKLNDWMLDNAIAFEFARTDWQYVLNTFVFGYGVAYKFSESEHGACNGNFLGIGADCSRRAILVEQAQNPGLLITNAELVGAWETQDSVTVEIKENVRAKVSITNSTFWGPIDRAVWMKSPHTQFTSTANHFENWNISGQGRPAIDIQAGRAIISGNTFSSLDTPVRVGEDAKSVIVMGNQASGGIHVDNHAGKLTQMTANEEHLAEWTQETRRAYRIDIGSEGDNAYLSNWHAQGDVLGLTQRWSGSTAGIRLPVNPGQPYHLALRLSVPEHALQPGAGIYLDGLLVYPFTGAITEELTLRISPAEETEVQLEIRCRGWVPNHITPESRDYRTLGVTVFYAEMREADYEGKLFDANTGEWLED